MRLDIEAGQSTKQIEKVVTVKLSEAYPSRLH